MSACPGCGVDHAGAHPEMSLAELPHLGVENVDILKAAGIVLVADLIELGAVEAYRRAETSGQPNLNLLYALEAAISGEHWLEVKRQHKDTLLAALAVARETTMEPAVMEHAL
jgi:DNA transformation protein